MVTRKTKIHTGHQSFLSSVSNTANVRSPGIKFEVPQGAAYLLPPPGEPFQPVLKLFTAAGAEISRNTKIYLAKLAPSDKAPRYYGFFAYAQFADLTTQQQRDVNFRDSLVVPLDVPGLVNTEKHQIWFEFEGPDAIDWTKAGTTFEFWVEERN